MKQTIGEIEDELMKLPYEIRQKEMDIIRTGDQIAELDKKNEFVKNQTKAAVAADKDPENDKVRFTNESLRDAETGRRLSENLEFQAQEKSLQEFKTLKAVDEVQLRFLNNQMRVRVAVLKGRDAE